MTGPARLLVAVAIVLAGCGGSDEPSRPTSTTIDSNASTEIVTLAVRAAARKLPLVDVTTSTAADDPNGLLGQPRQYVARVAWRDQRIRPDPVKGETIGVDTGGSMERFAALADLNERKQSLEATLGLLISAEVLFVHGLVLVRLPGTLNAQQVAEVDAALVEGLGPAAAPVTTATSGPRPPTTRRRRA